MFETVDLTGLNIFRFLFCLFLAKTFRGKVALSREVHVDGLYFPTPLIEFFGIPQLSSWGLYLVGLHTIVFSSVRCRGVSYEASPTRRLREPLPILPGLC